MKYFIFSLFMLPLFSSAQSKNDWLVGGTVTGVSLQNLQISPTVSYMITDNVQVGGAISYSSTTNYDYSLINVVGRYYANKHVGSARLFGELTAGVSVSDWSFDYGIGVGVMAFIAKRVYVSPCFSVTQFYDQDANLAISRGQTTVALGLRF